MSEGIVLTQAEAEKLALDFLMEDWNIPAEDRDWFGAIASRLITEDWYIVELGVEGYPDRWAIQVYRDTQECDPCYTFTSPLSGSEATSDLAELPESIAAMMTAERQS